MVEKLVEDYTPSKRQFLLRINLNEAGGGVCPRPGNMLLYVMLPQSVFGHFIQCLYPAVKRFPYAGLCFLHVRVLYPEREIGNDVHNGKTSLPVGITRRELNRVMVKIIVHVGDRELGTELVKHHNILPGVAVEGVLVIGNTVYVFPAMGAHYHAGFTYAGFAVDVYHLNVPVLVLPLVVTVVLAYVLNKAMVLDKVPA